MYKEMEATCVSSASPFKPPTQPTLIFRLLFALLIFILITLHSLRLQPLPRTVPESQMGTTRLAAGHMLLVLEARPTL